MSNPEKEKMLRGDRYKASDPSLRNERKMARTFCYDYNKTHPDEVEKRKNLLQKHLGLVKGECTVEPRFQCDYGYNIFLGKNFYSNYDLIILDVCEVRIGDNCLIGPRVSILTATHPIDSKERESGLEYGRRIKIGNNVWIGAGAVINPGVTIADNAIIASGAVVIKDVADFTMVAGVPAKVIRDVP